MFDDDLLLGVRYYLNIDRCAQKTLRDKPNKILGLKPVYGPTLFALNEFCNQSYYQSSNGRWKRYASTPSIAVKCCPSPTDLSEKCVK